MTRYTVELSLFEQGGHASDLLISEYAENNTTNCRTLRTYMFLLQMYTTATKLSTGYLHTSSLSDSALLLKIEFSKTIILNRK